MKRFVPVPPADDGFEWHSPTKWPWFTARRKGYLLEQRVVELERRLAHVEKFLRDAGTSK